MIKLFLKRIIISSFLLYSLNLFFVNFNFVIPFNFYSLLAIVFLGFPGLVVLILFKMLL